MFKRNMFIHILILQYKHNDIHSHINLLQYNIFIYILILQYKQNDIHSHINLLQYNIFIYILILQYHYHCSRRRWCMYHMCWAMRSRLALKVGSHSLFRSGFSFHTQHRPEKSSEAASRRRVLLSMMVRAWFGSSAPMPRVKLPSWNCESTSKSMLCRVTHVINILLTLVTS